MTTLQQPDLSRPAQTTPSRWRLLSWQLLGLLLILGVVLNHALEVTATPKKEW